MQRSRGGTGWQELKEECQWGWRVALQECHRAGACRPGEQLELYQNEKRESGRVDKGTGEEESK